MKTAFLATSFIQFWKTPSSSSTCIKQYHIRNIIVNAVGENFLMKSTYYISNYSIWSTRNLNYTTCNSVYIFTPEFQSFIISNNQNEPLQSFHQLDSLLFSLESDSKDITWHVTHDKLWLICQQGNTNENEALLSSPLHHDTCRVEPEDGPEHSVHPLTHNERLQLT